MKVSEMVGRENNAISINEGDMTVPLLSPNVIKFNDSILLKTVSFGLNGFFNACYLSINGKLLSMLGSDESAAASMIAASFYFARKPLVEAFLPTSLNPTTIELAETLLWINMAELIPDSIRLISSGALRGVQDLLFPTMVSLLFMIVIGVPAAWGINKVFNNEAEMMFYVRDVAMLLAGGIIAERCRRKIIAPQEEETTIMNATRHLLFSPPANEQNIPDVKVDMRSYSHGKTQK